MQDQLASRTALLPACRLCPEARPPSLASILCEPASAPRANGFVALLCPKVAAPSSTSRRCAPASVMRAKVRATTGVGCHRRPPLRAMRRPWRLGVLRWGGVEAATRRWDARGRQPGWSGVGRRLVREVPRRDWIRFWSCFIYASGYWALGWISITSDHTLLMMVYW
jgi:hypothetical protein